MLAYRQNGLTELWFSDVRAVFLQEGIIEASPARRVLNRQYAGDAGNSAVFFLEKYLVSGVSSPIDSLKFIAAHAVLMAGKLNPAGVEGLEILLCRHGAAFERVPDAELMELAAESDSLDSEMLNRLLP